MNGPVALQFPYRDVVFKVSLAAGIGLLVGIEREWTQKEIGVRTFAIAGLLGMLTTLLAPWFVVGGISAILLLVGFLNVHSLLRDRSLELTTSICLVVVFFLGALVGDAHYFTAATSAIVMMMLLAWKVELERFAGALRPEEIRSAVMLGLLSVVIFPLLPNRFVDPWQLINPQTIWLTIVVIAGIGFLNYSLLRLYGTRGMYYAAALGGLVNSTAAAAELSSKFRGGEESSSQAIAMLLITNAAMFVRNIVILALFAPKAVASAIFPLAAMAAVTTAWVFFIHRPPSVDPEPPKLSSPVSVKRVVKFGVLFLLLACAGTLGQRFFGSFGFLSVSVLGGLVSSASTTATAATLASSSQITPFTAGLATILTSIASSLVNLPIVYQQTKNKSLFRRLAIATSIINFIGLAATALIDLVTIKR